MDFLTWLEENNIQYSLKRSIDSYLFTLKDVTATNGILSIDYPCMLGRTPYSAVCLFVISYEDFILVKRDKTSLIISIDKFNIQRLPVI